MFLTEGRSIPLSLPRRFIGDLVHFAQQVPSHTMERRMRLRALAAAREAAFPRPGWAAIFLKAYALLAARRPELRQIYLPFPTPHLYEHPRNIASVAVSRPWGDDGEEAVFFGLIRSPETLGVWDIERRLQEFKEQPLETNSAYRRILWLTRMPRPIRRLLWWASLNLSGGFQAEYVGTYALSVVSSLGASGLQLLSPLTAALNYGVLERDGSLDVRLTYDHRVRDGRSAARALADLEDVLLGEVINELGYLRALRAA